MMILLLCAFSPPFSLKNKNKPDKSLSICIYKYLNREMQEIEQKFIKTIPDLRCVCGRDQTQGVYTHWYQRSKRGSAPENKS